MILLLGRSSISLMYSGCLESRSGAMHIYIYCTVYYVSHGYFCSLRPASNFAWFATRLSETTDYDTKLVRICYTCCGSARNKSLDLLEEPGKINKRQKGIKTLGERNHPAQNRHSAPDHASVFPRELLWRPGDLCCVATGKIGRLLCRGGHYFYCWESMLSDRDSMGLSEHDKKPRRTNKK